MGSMTWPKCFKTITGNPRATNSHRCAGPVTWLQNDVSFAWEQSSPLNKKVWVTFLN